MNFNSNIEYIKTINLNMNVICIEPIAYNKVAIGIKNEIKILNTENYNFTENINQVEHVTTVKYITNLNLLVCGLNNGAIKIWFCENDNYTLKNILKGHQESRCVYFLDFLPHEKLISASEDGSIKIWNNVNSNHSECSKTFPINQPNIIYKIKLIDNVRMAICNNFSGLIKIFNYLNGQEVQILNSEPNMITCLEILSKNSLASGIDDGTIKIWNLEMPNFYETLISGFEKVNCLKLLPNRILACSSDDGMIKLWNIENLTCTYSFSNLSPIKYFILSPSYFFLIINEDCIKFWKISNSLECLNTIWSKHVNTLKFLKNNSFAFCENDTGGIDIRDSDLNLTKTLSSYDNQNDSNGVFSLELLNDNRLASGHMKHVKIWNLKDGSCTKILTGHFSQVNYLKLIFVNLLISKDDDVFKLWNLDSFECIQTSMEHSGFRELKFVNKTNLASINKLSTKIILWCFNHEKKLLTFREEICLFNENSNEILCLESLGNENLIATGLNDKKIKIWKFWNSNNKFQEVRTLNGHLDSVTCLKLLPNKKLASGSSDNSIRIWDIENGKCINYIANTGHLFKISCLDIISFCKLSDVSSIILASTDSLCVKTWNILDNITFFEYKNDYENYQHKIN